MQRGDFFRVATATPQVKIGACRDNATHIERVIREAAEQSVEVVVTPELSITGYTCADLFLQSSLQRSAIRECEELIERLREVEIVGIVGLPIAYRNSLYNCAVVFAVGEVLAVIPKSHIPNYSEFYESRWFAPASRLDSSATVELCGARHPITPLSVFEIGGVACSVEICEDLWVASPPSSKIAGVAEVCFNLSASPEAVGKYDYLRSLVEQQSARCISGYVYCSAGRGESSTDLLFGGGGIIAENGRILASSDRFSLEDRLTIADLDIELLRNHRVRTTTFASEQIDIVHQTRMDLNIRHSKELKRTFDPHPFVPSSIKARSERCEEIFSIQSGGLIQRLSHTKCQRAIIGISGGLDSTLALLVAIRAFDRLGLDRRGVIGVTMPGFGTTGRTYNNAISLMRGLGVTIREISIRKACEQHFQDIGLPDDDRSVSYENSQARERTQILMDMANMEGGMVIGTGDLSELALGWATYNGDHMSMYGVNASVPKSLVRYLVGWVAEQSDYVAVKETLLDVIDTPVSPELLPADESGNIAQRTEDLVGPYELHDLFLYHFVRNGFSPRKIEMIARLAFEGEYDNETIRKWLKTFIRRFFSQQFKRSAMPDGVKVGSISLSPRGDWRMPSDATVDEWIGQLE